MVQDNVTHDEKYTTEKIKRVVLDVLVSVFAANNVARAC